MYDIFNPDGIFIERKSLKVLWQSGGSLYPKAKNNRLYCLRKKENGKVLGIFRK